jgi:hypothetical protein
MDVVWAVQLRFDGEPVLGYEATREDTLLTLARSLSREGA